ncbi:MAG: PmoA family protein [Balneolaceae bacterium]
MLRIINISDLVATAFFLLLIIIGCNAKQIDYTITVEAGTFDRQESVVTFYFPYEVPQGMYQMESESGEFIDLQVNDNNQGTFILDSLTAESIKSYHFIQEPVVLSPQVTSHPGENIVTFKGNGKNILSYYYNENNPPATLGSEYKRGGYIHPVYSPKGVILTNHLNSDGHSHHYGIWSAWTKTHFQGRTPDFWNVDALTGRVDHVDSVYADWSGSVYAGFRGLNYFIDLSSSDSVIALNEEWEVTIYRPLQEDNYYVFDLKVTQTANSHNKLVLPKYRYGGIGFRGHSEWSNSENVTFLTSSGHARDGHTKRARWCHIGGYINNKLAGITIMGSPDNFRHPQPMRIHPEEPFFNFAPTQLGEFSIEPGSPYISRYRYVTYDGEVDPEELNRIWNDFAYPPNVTVIAAD